MKKGTYRKIPVIKYEVCVEREDCRAFLCSTRNHSHCVAGNPNVDSRAAHRTPYSAVKEWDIQTEKEEYLDPKKLLSLFWPESVCL